MAQPARPAAIGQRAQALLQILHLDARQGNPNGWQDQEAGVVGEHMQALVLQYLRPADPIIAGGTLQCRRLPAE